jgi:hypothetical protein
LDFGGWISECGFRIVQISDSVCLSADRDLVLRGLLSFEGNENLHRLLILIIY